MYTCTCMYFISEFDVSEVLKVQRTMNKKMKMELEEYEQRMKDKSDITALTGTYMKCNSTLCSLSINTLNFLLSSIRNKIHMYVLITCTCTSTYNLVSCSHTQPTTKEGSGSNPLVMLIKSHSSG